MGRSAMGEGFRYRIWDKIETDPDVVWIRLANDGDERRTLLKKKIELRVCRRREISVLAEQRGGGGGLN